MARIIRSKSQPWPLEARLVATCAARRRASGRSRKTPLRMAVGGWAAEVISFTEVVSFCVCCFMRASRVELMRGIYGIQGGLELPCKINLGNANRFCPMHVLYSKCFKRSCCGIHPFAH